MFCEKDIWLSVLLMFFICSLYGQKSKEYQEYQDFLKCRRCILIAEQKSKAIEIIDIKRDGKMIWSWNAKKQGVKEEEVKWFSSPSDAKMVGNNKYMLITASGGAVGLIRVSDKKLMFYAYAGKNPHSAEILPDGNIVSASSNDNKLTVYHVDTLVSPQKALKNAKTIKIPFAHNAVWDSKRNRLWASGKNYLYEISYNFDYEHPQLNIVDKIKLPGDNAHDMVPKHGSKKKLWLTNSTDIYEINVGSKKVRRAKNISQRKSIKSISSGSIGFPTILIKPKEKWWTDEVIDEKGNRVYKKKGLRIYKARWVLPNRFSYKKQTAFKFE